MPDKNEPSRTQTKDLKQQGERQQTGALQKRSSATPGLGIGAFSLVRRMLEDMDRMVEGFGGGGLQLWSPPIETFVRNGQFVLKADLPGLSPDDVRLEAGDDALILEGERKSESEVEEKGTWRSERTYGRFSRTIPLPEGAELDNAKAKFENGVLEVSIPVREDTSRRRRIEIQGASKTGSVH